MKSTKHFNIRIVVLSALLIVASVFLVIGLNNYLKQSVHDERTNYLTAQTTTTEELLNSQLNQYLNYARVCGEVVSAENNIGLTLDNFIAKMNDKLYMDGSRLILIDEDCNWYGESGTTGKITSMESYLDNTPEEVTYMTTGVDVDVESICFRVRLRKPKTFATKDGDITIRYCTVIYYMDKMEEQFEAAFPYGGNNFIVDDTGLMIYENLGLGKIVDGSNVFTKYKKVAFINDDETGEEKLESIRSGQVSIGEFKGNGESYFICAAPLSINNWSLIFVFPSSVLMSGNYLNTLALYITLIVGLAGCALILFYVLVLRNRNVRKQLDTEMKANIYLEKASRAKGDFISNMSHDLRTPINGILGMTRIARGENNPAKTNDCLDKINVSSNYLLALVNDVLDMSKIESGTIELDKRSVNIVEFLENTLIIIKGQADDRKLIIDKAFDELKGLRVYADEVRLRQIFINILGNSVKFTPEGGHIGLKARVIKTGKVNRAEGNAEGNGTSSTIRFTMYDTGCGMSEEFLKNIWDRFSQEHSGSRSELKGTGLGMAITKSLVDIMGGSIKVESKLGEGSKFIIDLTFDNDESVNEKDISGLKALLAEDNLINMEIIKELLEDKGVAAEEAETGREALEIFKASEEGHFDLILTDIMMPEMDGIEFTRALRALDRADAKSIPVIAMTANADKDDVASAKAAGINDYLTKPIDSGKLVEVIGRWVR